MNRFTKILGEDEPKPPPPKKAVASPTPQRQRPNSQELGADVKATFWDVVFGRGRPRTREEQIEDVLARQPSIAPAQVQVPIRVLRGLEGVPLAPPDPDMILDLRGEIDSLVDDVITPTETQPPPRNRR